MPYTVFSTAPSRSAIPAVAFVRKYTVIIIRVKFLVGFSIRFTRLGALCQGEDSMIVSVVGLLGWRL